MVSDPQRTPEQVREHYEIEKVVAARLRAGTSEKRRFPYGELHYELYHRVPDHPQLTRKRAPSEAEDDIRRQWYRPSEEHFKPLYKLSMNRKRSHPGISRVS